MPGKSGHSNHLLTQSLCCAIAACFTNGVSAADWPQWRGENQDGVSQESDWSSDWADDGPKRLWEFSPGSGYGTVSVVGNRLYVIGGSGESEETDTVYCVNSETGETVWQHSYARQERPERTPTRRASSNTTPTVHRGRVYTYSGDAQLFCFDAASGDVVWKRELMTELEVRHPQYDHNSSPVIVGDLVVVLARLPNASIIAFDKNNGTEAWRAFHETRRGALGGFWSTPVFRIVDGKPCLVYLPGLSVVGMNPSSGETLWKYDFAAEGIDQASKGAVAAAPIVSENRVFFPFHPDHGRGFSACIQIVDSQPRLLWKSIELAHWWLSPVVWNNHVIALDQGPAAEGNKAGALYCYDLESGKLKWSSYEIGEKSRDTIAKGAKLLVAGDRLLALNDQGSLIVARLNEKEPELLATTRVFRRAGRYWTAPVLAHGRLYCRGGRNGDLVCLDVSK